MSQSANSIRVETRPDGFGAVVTGLDLSQPFAEDAADTLRRQWSESGVLVFPDQSLEPDELEAFTLSLGSFGEDPFIEAMEGHRNILEVRREPDEKLSDRAQTRR